MDLNLDQLQEKKVLVFFKSELIKQNFCVLNDVHIRHSTNVENSSYVLFASTNLSGEYDGQVTPHNGS